jgi:hydrogenase maturation protein HypF
MILLTSRTGKTIGARRVTLRYSVTRREGEDEQHTVIRRVRVHIDGTVQGVGFRPFVYRLAQEYGVSGWVTNTAQGVIVEAEAPSEQIDTFLADLQTRKPPHALIRAMTVQAVDPDGGGAFEIHHSESSGAKSAGILTDLATCPGCLSDILDPANRRYRYPFTNCTYCGPRYSIVEALPYDRPNTSMRHFPMCEECRAEYDDPLNRRFHAQPTACPRCGPQLALWDRAGEILARHDEALIRSADAIRAGSIVALKGLGGFQLIVDARNADAIRRLRQRKRRPDKPFALMFPTLQGTSEHCEVSALEAELLTSAEAPIVLLQRLTDALPMEIAPGNPNIGVMLPYTPLHHLLMRELDAPIVATSGNLSGEPICIDEQDALNRLGGIADLFLVHDRPIARHVDDSVVRVMGGRETILRRARGYAPTPLMLPDSAPAAIAVGAHLKNTVAISVGQQAIVSQHIGDLEALESLEAFETTVSDLQRLYELKPETIVCDQHPNYGSTEYARASGLPLIPVQHHEAHVLSCMLEHGIEPPVLGVSWDGTGYGSDGTAWGGEFLLIEPESSRRVAHIRPFALPGGDLAAREPRRSALGLLLETGDLPPDLPPVQAFSPTEFRLIETAVRKGINAPRTTSVGRLFDAVASLIGLMQTVTFEGQAAMALEFACGNTEECYPYRITTITGTDGDVRRMIDWSPFLSALIEDFRRGVGVDEISGRFHNSLVEIIVDVARDVGQPQIVLTGGCFMNKTLLERTLDRLQEAGFRPYWHRLVPPNDGGIALGQLAAAIRSKGHVFSRTGEDYQRG